MRKRLYYILGVFYFLIFFNMGCNYFYEPPIADFTLSDTLIYIGERISFSTNNLGGSYKRVKWTITNNDTYSSEVTSGSFSQVFKDPGVYDVTLKLENKGGESTLTKYGAFTVKNNKFSYVTKDESYQYFYDIFRSTVFYSSELGYSYPLKITELQHIFYEDPIPPYWTSDTVMFWIKDIVLDSVLYNSPVMTIGYANRGYLTKTFHVPDDLVIYHDFCVTFMVFEYPMPCSPFSLGKQSSQAHNLYDENFEFTTQVTIEEINEKRQKTLSYIKTDVP